MVPNTRPIVELHHDNENIVPGRRGSGWLPTIRLEGYSGVPRLFSSIDFQEEVTVEIK